MNELSLGKLKAEDMTGTRANLAGICCSLDDGRWLKGRHDRLSSVAQHVAGSV